MLRASLAAEAVKKHSFPPPSSSFFGSYSSQPGSPPTSGAQHKGFQRGPELDSRYHPEFGAFLSPQEETQSPQQSAPVSPHPPASGNR